MPPQELVPTWTLARLAGCDRRTAEKRLREAGLTPDAMLAHATDFPSPLWAKHRVLDLVQTIGRRNILEDFIAPSASRE